MNAHATLEDRRRLDALASYDILGTPRERDFDDLVQLVSEICETPMAVVNLLAADSQFFKAEVGLGVRETPIDTSFCAKAILEDDFLEVPDASLDPRFEHNPLVTGAPGIRFYAGKLLKTPEGLPIGTLCVLDTRPRHLTGLQRMALDVLGRQVMSQIELRKAVSRRDDLLQQRQVVQKEMAHRLKNTLAMVQAIATQTLRKTTDRGSLAEFESRLQSLAAAHDVLLLDQWESGELETIARGVLANLAPEERFSIKGPPVSLGARSALSVSLIIHELATNAVKYGALSVVDGRVEIDWSVEGDAFVFTWRERGGPKVTAPSTKGFGSKLVGMGLVGSGDVELRYETTGVAAKLTASLQELCLS